MNVMKKITMKQVCLILSMIALPLLGYSQFIGDTVIAYVDNKVEIKVAVADYAEIKKSDSVQLALQSFKKLIPEFVDRLSAEEAELVRYSPGGNLTIEPGDPKINYLNMDGKLSYTGFRDQVIINGENYKIFISTTDLPLLYDLDMSECMANVVSKLPEPTKRSMSISYECKDNKITQLEGENLLPDFLELQLGAGGSLIKSKWLADISFGVSLGFNKKGVLRGPTLSSNMIFDFDAEESMNINTFVNAGYFWDVSRKSEKPRTLGFDVGYLISRQGEMFGENTFKVSATWSPAKHVNVSPQLFITDNFSQAFPGIRIGFGF